MALDPTLLAALEAQGLRACHAIKIELTHDTIRLFDGSGTVTLNGESYVGIDDLFGTLDMIGSISEAISDQSPTLEITLFTKSQSGLVKLAQPEQQNSLVSVYFAVIDETTASPIGSPELIWKGRLDTCKVRASAEVQAIELSTVSAFDRLFASEEGARLNPVWHKRIWPYETGFDQVVEALSETFWGQEGGGSGVGGGGRRGLIGYGVRRIAEY